MNECVMETYAELLLQDRVDKFLLVERRQASELTRLRVPGTYSSFVIPLSTNF